MPIWFRTDEFLYDEESCPPFDVPAYSGHFRVFGSHPSMQPLRLCMLHTNDIPRTFPDTSFVENTYAKWFADRTGLILHGSLSYGYVSPLHSWKVDNGCCRPEWIGWYCFHCRKQR